MQASDSGLSVAATDVTRRFVQVDGRVVHYRVSGTGPAVVMLHDSPRSSRLHLDTIRRLSCRFRVFALDTPGYGNSQPLAGDSPEVTDFAHALGAVLEQLQLGDAPLYATHTSAKIALEYAATGARRGPIILDGLSIPATLAKAEFVDRYMRPFRIEETGGYLAAEWTRMRDMVRWFPWFAQRPGTRMPIALPADEWVSDYIIDFFSAGPHYASAYAAAMRYDPRLALRAVRCPTLVAARSDDVLYAYLDSVPVDDNPSLSVERLPADREAWLTWLEESFARTTADAAPFLAAAPQPRHGSLYVDLAHGQLLVHRAGPEGQRPLLILSAPTTLQALAWQAALADRATLVPELPGFGESAPLPEPSIAATADALAAMFRALDIGEADLLATDFATPLGATLAARYPDLIARVVLDGCFALPDNKRAVFSRALCPEFPFDAGGGHVHRYWHMLRDAEASWPWYATAAEARRATEPLLDANGLHAALVGLLKQPVHYGDVARAACDSPGADRYPGFSQPALLFDRPDDPGYRGANALGSRLPAGTIVERAAGITEAASAVAAFLAPVAEAALRKPAL